MRYISSMGLFFMNFNTLWYTTWNVHFNCCVFGFLSFYSPVSVRRRAHLLCLFWRLDLDWLIDWLSSCLVTNSIGLIVVVSLTVSEMCPCKGRKWQRFHSALSFDFLAYECPSNLSQRQELIKRWDTRTWRDVSSYMVTYSPLNYRYHLYSRNIF